MATAVKKLKKAASRKFLIWVGIPFAIFMLIFVPISVPQGQAIANGYGFMVEEILKTTVAISPGANALQLIINSSREVKKLQLKFSQNVNSITIKYKSNGHFAKTIGQQNETDSAVFCNENDPGWQGIAVAGQFDFDTKVFIAVENLDGYYIEIEVDAKVATEMSVTVE